MNYKQFYDGANFALDAVEKQLGKWTNDPREVIKAVRETITEEQTKEIERDIERSKQLLIKIEERNYERQ